MQSNIVNANIDETLNEIRFSVNFKWRLSIQIKKRLATAKQGLNNMQDLWKVQSDG